MSSKQHLDALAAERAHSATLRKMILLVAAVGGLGMYFAHALPKRLDLHVAPDIKAGDTVRFADGQAPVPDVNVYGFAYYIWQQINRWQTDGSKDYGQQIFRFQSYITPSCRDQLQADMQNRHQAGELRNRTRQMTEIPGLSYAANRVIADGSAAWTVLLDMQLMETFRGQPVKDAFKSQSDIWNAITVPVGTGKWRLDLALANRMQLEDAGLLTGSIQTSGNCVSCQKELFFSHRRDAGETGRQMGFIMLKAA